uniref:RRM domain-containing protein n=1 Tax=Strombidinopsis acuminata TaxID=141414 RepID=A0A7S3XB15_9SPIT|mmetsp:Transcript_96673/g.133174  ORF Transcript_96673/g.133174 Transcript_96673/m.133174 type:complete len:219 (+) Transcript_96673:96-752(+)
MLGVLPGAPMVQPTIGPAMPSALTNQMTAAQAAAVGAVLSSKPAAPTAESSTLRKASGKIWRDPTLDDWPKEDYRLFCGDLGNEVTDDLLANAFRKYSSFQKAKVIRDKRTGKTKGYGFVSFSAPEDMVAALRDVNGRYVGNRPVRLKKSNWKDKSIDSDKNLNSGLRKLTYCVPQDSKSLQKFKKIKQKQDPAKQKERQKLRAAEEDFAAMATRKKK